MAVKPKNRFKSAQDMHAALRTFMNRLSERPTSSTVVDLIRKLAPEGRLLKLQQSYGPPDTTDVSSFDAVAPAMLGGAVPEAPDSEPLPREAPAAESRTVRDDDPTLPAVSYDDDAPTLDHDRREASGMGPSLGKFLFLLVVLSFFGVTAGLVVTAAVLSHRRAAADAALAAVATAESADAAPSAPDATPLGDLSLFIADAAPRTDARQPDAADSPTDAEAPRDTAADRAPTAEADVLRPGLLTVQTLHPAMLFVGRRRVGLTPVDDLELEPGRYRIRVRSRHGLRRATVDIRAGQETRIVINL
jgi:hypothetical protein